MRVENGAVSVILSVKFHEDFEFVVWILDKLQISQPPQHCLPVSLVELVSWLILVD